MRPLYLSIALLIAVVAVAQGPAHILYLIGDAGEAGPDHSQPVLDLVNQVSATDSAKARTLVFLGDNLYEYGLHETGDKDRAHDERNINAQIELMREFPGKSFIIPGNHDWCQGKTNGRDQLAREEAYVEQAMATNVFLPDEGCPGPVAIELGDQAVLLLIDTQWWLQKDRHKDGIVDSCATIPDERFLEAVRSGMAAYPHRRIILAGHHPMYTHGSHGGHFTVRDHLFPLTNLVPALYLPLPVVGSIYPLYRSVFGACQDLAHPRNKALRDGLCALLKARPGSVYASGHEHALEYIVRDGDHFVVSGAGAKSTPLGKSADMPFGASERGFVRIILAPDGTASVQYFTVTGGTTPVYQVLF